LNLFHFETVNIEEGIPTMKISWDLTHKLTKDEFSPENIYAN
jgi:hypothetical protein